MLERQSYSGGVRWIVIDDCETPSEVTLRRQNWNVEIVRPQPFWKTGDNTQGRNLLIGLDMAEEDKDCRLTVFEDDDWAHPDWFSRLDAELNKAELVGEGQAHYYNVRSRRYGNLRNYHHASLRSTAMRGKALVTFRQVLGRRSQYYDFDLWKAHERKHVFFSDLTVGLKGMPGRPGIATGHDPEWGVYDPEMRKLRDWIGDDANWYTDFYEEPVMKQAKPTKQMRALTGFPYGERGWIEKDQVFSLRDDKEEKLFISCGRAAPLDAAQTTSAPRPRKLKVETQEEKLAPVVVEKAADPEPAPTEEQEAPAEEEKAEDDAAPKRGRRKTLSLSKDD